MASSLFMTCHKKGVPINLFFLRENGGGGVNDNKKVCVCALPARDLEGVPVGSLTPQPKITIKTATVSLTHGRAKSKTAAEATTRKEKDGKFAVLLLLLLFWRGGSAATALSSSSSLPPPPPPSPRAQQAEAIILSLKKQVSFLFTV